MRQHGKVVQILAKATHACTVESNPRFCPLKISGEYKKERCISTSVEQRENNPPPWTASVALAIGFAFSTGRVPLRGAAMACDSSVVSILKLLAPAVACADPSCWPSSTSACGKAEMASKEGRSVAEAATTCATPMLLQLRRAFILNWRTILGGSRGMTGGRRNPFDKSKPDVLTPLEEVPAVLLEDAPDVSGLQSWWPPPPPPPPPPPAPSVDVATPACNIHTAAIANGFFYLLKKKPVSFLDASGFKRKKRKIAPTGKIKVALIAASGEGKRNSKPSRRQWH